MAGQVIEQTDVTPQPAKAPVLRVLVVDDEPLIRWSLAEALGARGYDVVEKGDARGACTAVLDTAIDFDVVVLDYRLPDSDDLSLLASIRRYSPRSRVILMTAFGTSELVRDALNLGAFRVVGKPFDVEEFSDLVGQAAMLGSSGAASC
jgi:DNA-binding NtrC family response regulator